MSEFNETFFAVIYAQDGELHSSSGSVGMIEDNDWYLSESPANRDKISTFMESAEMGDAKTFGEVTLLRIPEESQLCCECCY